MKRIAASLARARDIAPGVLIAVRAGSITAAFAAAFVMFGWSTATAAVVIASGIAFVVGWAGGREPHTDLAAELEETRKRLESLALRDPLTGVLNHRAFQDALETELRRARRESWPVSVVAVDIDGFREVNDVRGHAHGDALLVTVAEALASNLRPGDQCGRVGGDEFMLTLSSCDAEGAREVVTRLRAGIDSRALASQVGMISISAGVAEFPSHSLGRSELMRYADAAMLRARAEGAGSTVVHSSEDVALVDESAQARRGALFNTVHALARAVDARDGYTHMHSQRVAFYAATLAAAMKLGDERVEEIRMAGLLHDVGKIGIRDAILLKPGPLTRDEFTVMRRHSELGRAIIAGAGLNEIALWVGHLHERVDGEGYPDGLAGDEIPIESRVLHVADALEAMTCPRAYRKPKTPEEAVEELERHAGTQFDAAAVQVMSRLVRERAIEVGEQPRLGHPLAGGASALAGD
ncbi:MAG: diguanylate cyclase [Actinomycetota bacterium]|nr:diguanylate cyclase [Actinomycetota bacterium]